MSSEQARRENVVKEVEVEKDRVPKMTSHFESMAKEGESGGTQTQFVSLSDEGDKTQMHRTQMPHSVGKFVTSSEGTEKKASLDDIHDYRANAQQKSMDTIRAAEERYNKAKESLSHGDQEASGKGREEIQGKGRESGVHVTHAGAESGQESGGGRIHGGIEAAPVLGQEARGSLAGKEGTHGFHGEKAEHAKLLAAGGGEMREREGQESVGGTVGEKGRQAKESVGQGTQRASDYVTEKGREAGHVAGQKGQETKEQAGRAKDYTMEKAKEAAEQTGKAKDYTLQKAVEAKDVAAEKAQRGTEYVTEKGKQTGNTAAEQAARAKDFALQKAVEAKDVAAEKARIASQYVTEKSKEAGNVAAEKGQVAKEQTVSMTGKAKDYTVQKAGEAVESSKEAAEYAKETLVEGGKGAAHYAGVAAEIAAAVGWTAAHFTTEKVVQGTKAVAGTVEGAVGYVGHKTAEVGSKAVDLTKEKAATAADTVVGFTARKKEEAQHRGQGMHQGGEEETEPGFDKEQRRGHGEEYGSKGEAGEATSEEYGGGRGSEKDVYGYGTQGMSGEAELFAGGGRRDERYVEEEGVGAGGVLGAIGETIAEIAQTTKNIVIGDTPVSTQEHGTTTDYMRREHR